MKKQLTAVFLALISMVSLSMSLLAANATEESENLAAPVLDKVRNAVVYNMENDSYIFEKNADEVIYPASTVKLMTAIIAVDALGHDMTREITVPAEAIVGTTGNNIALRRDEVLTVEQLLYALILGGANDAANVLAYEIAGSVEAFTILMNEKAEEFGAYNTFYTNPTGMHDPAMVTTAKDTAIIATIAYNTSPICEMATAEKFAIDATNKAPRRIIFNKNYYFSTNVEYIYKWNVPRGLNAGYTPQGGNCVVTTGTRDGLTYIVVVMGAEQDDTYIYSYTGAADLLKWAYKAYGYTNVLTTADLICEVPVKLSSSADYVTLFPSQNVELYLPTYIDPSKDVEIITTLDVDYFTAPVNEGARGGTITVFYNGENLGSYDLITRNSVNRDNILYVLDVVKMLASTRAFKIIVGTASIAVVGYTAALAFVRANKSVKKRKY